MANRVVNASFLSTSGIVAVGMAGAAISVDEHNAGAPGRRAAYTIGTRSAGANEVGIQFGGPIPVAPNARVYAAVDARASHGHSGVLLWLRANGTETGQRQAMTQRTPAPNYGIRPRGLPRAFARWRGGFTSPVDATHCILRVALTDPLPAVGANVQIEVIRPYVGADAPSVWQTGVHSEADLNLPVWPADWPAPNADGFSVTAVGSRLAFETDAGIPFQRRINRGGFSRASVELALDQFQRDELQVLYETASEFWFTRPDTLELCRGSWIEGGEPKDQGTGPGRTVSLEFMLEVA